MNIKILFFFLHQKIGSFIITKYNIKRKIKELNIKTIFWMDDLHFRQNYNFNYHLLQIPNNNNFIK